MTVDLRSTDASSDHPTARKSPQGFLPSYGQKAADAYCRSMWFSFPQTGLPQSRAALEGLEPYEGKLSRPVLRGE